MECQRLKFAVMRNFAPAIVIVILIMLSGGCTKDQDDQGYRAASFKFKSDSGYTYLDDTHPVGDTIHIGVTVEEGSKRLYTFLVNRTYDAGQPQRMDSLHIPSAPFYYDTTFVLRDQPGVERWTFIAVEGNGDRTQRHLTLTAE